MTLDVAAAYLEHAGALVGWYRRRGLTREEAEDLTADVFCKALGYQERYEERGRPVGAWLSTVARSVLTDWLRKRASNGAGQIMLVGLDAADEVAGALDVHPLDPDLLAGLRGLPRRQAEAVVLRDLHDLSSQQVAQRMGISENEVRKLCLRGRRRLRRLLEGHAVAPTSEGLDALIAQALAARAITRGRRSA